MKVFPQPKNMSCSKLYIGKRNFKIIQNEFSDSNLEYIISKLNLDKEGAPLEICSDDSFAKERYRLSLTNEGAKITASTSRGVYNAVTTLIQIMRSYDIMCVEIDDEPDFEDRSVLIDMVSRVTNIEELKKLIDLFAELKYNQIQINFDNLHFELKSFMKYCKWDEVVTIDYITEVKNYCKKHYIDLVPIHNSFGHMEAFLIQPDFNDFAECPNGFDRTDEYNYTNHMPPGTLDPNDPRSIEFMDRLYSDLLVYFDSDKFNVCCDEAFELGKGKSKELAEKIGIKKIYTDYMNKLHKLCEKYDKKMLFWADMIIDEPIYLKDMPTDSVPITWGYEEEHPFEMQCKALMESGLEFYVASGTSSWSDCLGRSENALVNQREAAIKGKKYGAKGYFLTDWRACNHPHHIICYVPYAYSAGLAWNVEAHKEIDRAFNYLDENFFFEKGFSEYLYDCGNAYKLEAYKRFNTTAHFTATNTPLNDSYYLYDQTPEHFENMIDYAQKQLKKIDKFVNCSEEFKDEIIHDLKTYIAFAKVCIYKLNGSVSKEEIISELKERQLENHRIWIKYNSEFGSNRFTDRTNKIIDAMKE